MTRRHWIVLLMIVPVFLPAQQDFRKVASAGYVFLTIPVGARTASLGEASIALKDLGPEACFANPAALPWTNAEHQAMVVYSKWFAETDHMAAAYSYTAGDLGTFALGVVRLDYGSIPGYRNPGAEKKGEYIATGSYTADAIALGLSYARRLTERFSFGLTGRYVQERIDMYRSSNVVFDGGIYYDTGFRSLRIAGVVRNFGVESKYLQGLFKMPADFRFGAAMDVYGTPGETHLLTVGAEMLHPTDNIERMNLSAEYWFDGFVAVRGGYKFFTDEESWTAGLGLRQPFGGIDVSVVDLGRLGTNVRFSVLFTGH